MEWKERTARAVRSFFVTAQVFFLTRFRSQLKLPVNLSSPVFCPFIRDADFAARAPWHVAERRLLDYLLIYVSQGQCEFTVDSQKHPLITGDWCLIQPGQTVELRGLTSTLTPYAHFDVWFHARRDESFATRPGQLDLTPHRELLQPRFDELARVPPVFAAPDANWKDDWLEIIELWSRGGQLARLESQTRLATWLLSLARYFDNYATPRAEASRLGWVPSFLSTHLSDPISIPAMAARARLSPSRFNVVFREFYGVSPGQYLLQMRISHAAELLRSSDWTLAHIADLCGFSDVHHFAKTFKRARKVAPGKWRQMNEK